MKHARFHMSPLSIVADGKNDNHHLSLIKAMGVYMFMYDTGPRGERMVSPTWNNGMARHLITNATSRDWNNVHHIAVKTPRRAAVLKVKAWVSTLSSFRPDGRRAPVFRDLAEAVRLVTQRLSSTRFDYFAHISRRAFKQPGKTGCRSHRRR
jgi:5-methylcytosine-specific restriction endonuclease McrA